MGRSANAYAVLREGKAILIDAGFSDLIPATDELSKTHSVEGIILTHRHVAAQADALKQFGERYSLVLYMHPSDANHPQGKMTGLHYENPLAHPALEALNIHVIPFAGHTEGHIALYLEDHGGVLLTGDAAMGPTFKAHEQGFRSFVRPPYDFNVDDTALRQNWLEFGQPIRTLAPYHGGLAVDEPLAELISPLVRTDVTPSLAH